MLNTFLSVSIRKIVLTHYKADQFLDGILSVPVSKYHVLSIDCILLLNNINNIKILNTRLY